MGKSGQVLLMVAPIALLTGLIVTASTQPGEDAVTDRLAITDRISQYAYHWDAKNADAFADLFTEDVVIERWVRGELRSRLEGRDALHAYARESHQGRLADRQTRHHMSSVVFIELNADTAKTENMVLITHQTESDAAARNAGAGIYRNTWRRTGQGWKISKRVLHSD